MIHRRKERRNAISYNPQIRTPSESPKDSEDESANSDHTTEPPNAIPYPSPPTHSPFNGLEPGQKDGSSRSKLPTTGRKSAPSPPLRDIRTAPQLRSPSSLQSTKPHRERKKKDKTDKTSGVSVLQSIPERKDESSSGSDTVCMKEARSTRHGERIEAGKREKEAMELDDPDIPGASAQSGLASTMRMGGDTQYETEDETGRKSRLTCTRK